MNWGKNEGFHKENFGRLVRKVAVQAKKVRMEHREPHGNKKLPDKDSKWRNKKSVHSVRKGKHTHETPIVNNHYKVERIGDCVLVLKWKRDSSDALPCLNPTRKAQGSSHYISICDHSDIKKNKTMLLEEYRSTKKVRLANAEKETVTLLTCNTLQQSPILRYSKHELGKVK